VVKIVRSYSLPGG